MVVEQVHARVLFLVVGLAVLALLREPLRYPDRPGSRGFLVTVLSVSVWLGSSGLLYFVPDLAGQLALYNVLLFAVMGTFLGWILLAVEFSTQRLASRRLLLLLGAVGAGHFLLLWTNYVWLHELLYRSTTSLDGAVLVPDRGPAFWVHTFTIHGIILLSTGLFAREIVGSAGLRRRQATLLVLALVPGLAANAYWLFGDHALTWDPTPLGVVVGVGALAWALYRTGVLEVVPVARQRVVEEMADAVVTLDPEDRVLDWNDAALELFGVDRPRVGMPIDEFFAPLDDASRSALRTDGDAETRITFESEGRLRHCSAQVSSIQLAGGRDAGRVVTFRDVTPTVHRERQLAETNESLAAFAEVVSHDVQGPLMELRGSADLAVLTEDPEQVDHVLHAVDRMEELVDDMLGLARSGRQIEDTEPVGLPAVARAAWRSVWSVDAHLAIEDDRRVRADPGRLQQLLENLFWNAVEHGGRGVTVRVLPTPDGFAVEDDGPGIPPADRERAFDRGVSDAEDGSGLGLAIVRGIVEAHGWSIEATAAPGGGARFEISGVAFEE